MIDLRSLEGHLAPRCHVLVADEPLHLEDLRRRIPGTVLENLSNLNLSKPA